MTRNQLSTLTRRLVLPAACLLMAGGAPSALVAAAPPGQASAPQEGAGIDPGVLLDAVSEAPVVVLRLASVAMCAALSSALEDALAAAPAQAHERLAAVARRADELYQERLEGLQALCAERLAQLLPGAPEEALAELRQALEERILSDLGTQVMALLGGEGEPVDEGED